MTFRLYSVFVLYFDIININIQHGIIYEGCSICNETVLVTFTFYKLKYKDTSIINNNNNNNNNLYCNGDTCISQQQFKHKVKR